MDNMIFKKIWEDDGFYKISVYVTSSEISISNSIFVNHSDITYLSSMIDKYFQSNKEFIWEAGVKKSDTEPYFKCKFYPMNIRGHIKIRIFMDIQNTFDEIGYSEFTIITESGLLGKFGSGIKKLNFACVGESVGLLDE